MKKLLLLFLVLFMLAGATGCTNSEKKEEKTLEDLVDEAIGAFLKNHATNYVNPETSKYDYHVVRAIAALEQVDSKVKLSSYATKVQVEEDLIKEYTNISELSKALLVLDAFGANKVALKDQVEAITEVDKYSYSHGLIALKQLHIESDLKTELVSKIPVIHPDDYRDADYAGSALMALGEDEAEMDDLMGLIEASLSKDGIMFWGAPSGATTATVILGLLSQGISPTSVAYTTEGVDLITALLAYEEDGAFKNELDKFVDLDFATPQAFAALVAYKIYQSNQKAFNLFLS